MALTDLTRLVARVPAERHGPIVSKAFTRDDDDAGFLPPPSRQRSATRLTAYGTRLMREHLATLDAADPAALRLASTLEGADVIAPAGGDVAALGAAVRVRDERGAEREIVLVTVDEVGLVPRGVGIGAPLGRALLGSRADDVVAVESPREEELTVVAVRWPE